MWQRQSRSRSRLVCGASAVVILWLIGGYKDVEPAIHSHWSSDEQDTTFEEGHSVAGARQLLAQLPNCTPPAIEQFPGTYFTPQQRAQGAIALHIVVSLYMFLGLALACDDYFVPSLEILCDVLKMKPDVAGATFMAAGSSAPELATAVIGVFIAEDDIGLGSVVGSAVFNIMLVISVCALFAGAVVPLSWWPLFRDCIFYTLSIAALVLVIYDEEVHWYEALILLILYGLYILLMYFNSHIDNYISSHNVTFCGKKQKDEENELVIYDKAATTADSDEEDCSDTRKLLTSNGGSRAANGNPSLECSSAAHEQQICTNSRTFDDDEPEESCMTPPEGLCRRLLWCISLPLSAAMCVTTPDCRRKRWRNWFFVTFLVSCVWISLFSYVMIWMITIVGFTFHVPDTVMGLTFIAAGVSVPDAIASLLVVRDGLGDMAVSNAVGSNVFDILLCLGLPWFLKTVLVTPGQPVQVYSAGLVYSSLTLLSTVVFLLTATHLNGWKLDIKFGIVLLITYFIFMILAILYELNKFGYVHPPECPSDA